MTPTLRLDIWSDVMCPFCYIGKRRLEAALEAVPFKDQVEVVWHSFLLDPDMKPEPGVDIYDYLARRKGQSRNWSIAMHRQVATMARSVGLVYDFDRLVVANSFDAHRLLQLAKQHGKGDAMKERLLKAYFSEGKNIGDHPTLVQLAQEAGLDAAEAARTLESGAFADVVRSEAQLAQQIGIGGVPFFLFNQQFVVQGAQDTFAFINALQSAWQKVHEPHVVNVPEVADGSACTVDGDC